MKKIVFYSWQSDLPNATNRTLIESALKNAATEIIKDDSIDVEPVIDRDTKGVAGAPDIASTIFAKILASDIFVADISIISKPKGKRATPNPNVLIELGYALKTLGHERIVLVFNEAFGEISTLPFDLKTRRVLTYNCPDNLVNKSAVKKELVNDFKSALVAGIAHIPKVYSRSNVLDAIENQLPNKPIVLREYLTSLLSELKEIQPKMHRDGGTANDLISAFSLTQPAFIVFSKISEVITLMDDMDSAQEIYKWFGKIFECYEPKSNDSGNESNADGDFFKLVGHELFVIFITPFIKEEKWANLQIILKMEFRSENHRYGVSKKTNWTELSEYSPLLADESVKIRIKDLHANLLKERHTTGGLASTSPFKDFVETDFFLYLFGSGLTETDFSWLWYPRSYFFLDHTPTFIIESENYPTAMTIAHSLLISDIDEFKKRVAFASKFENIRHSPINNHEINKIGSTGGASFITRGI